MPCALHFEFIIYLFIYLFWIYSGLTGFQRVQITGQALLIHHSDKIIWTRWCWVLLRSAWAYINQVELEQFQTSVMFYIFYATVQYTQSLISNFLYKIYH
jgi:hypothetical protein